MYSSGAGKHEESDLFRFLLQLQNISRIYSFHGFLIRGGVTIGQISHSENTCFGPALVRAYQLESQFAFYPRVVLDPKVEWGIWEEQHTAKCEPAGESWRASSSLIDVDATTKHCLTEVGDDDLLALDILEPIRHRMKSKPIGTFPPFEGVDFLKNLMETLVAQLTGRHYERNVDVKLRWLLRRLAAKIEDLNVPDILPKIEIVHEIIDATEVDKPAES